MPRKLTDRQFLALGWLAVLGKATPQDLPMSRDTARHVLSGLTRRGYATKDSGSFTATPDGLTALAAARDRARREAGI